MAQTEGQASPEGMEGNKHGLSKEMKGVRQGWQGWSMSVEVPRDAWRGRREPACAANLKIIGEK